MIAAAAAAGLQLLGLYLHHRRRRAQYRRPWVELWRTAERQGLGRASDLEFRLDGTHRLRLSAELTTPGRADLVARAEAVAQWSGLRWTKIHGQPAQPPPSPLPSGGVFDFVLEDLLRATQALGAECTLSGGYLALRINGARPSPVLIQRFQTAIRCLLP